MAFVVEDGTGKADANSYTSVEFANSYFADRGVLDWSGTIVSKQTWLVQATDYIESRFGQCFVGIPQYSEDPAQALHFPVISDKYPVNSIPIKLQQACCEYALRAKASSLAPDLKYTDTGYSIESAKEKVGPLEEEIKYATGSGTREYFKAYPAADMLLAGLVVNSRNGKVIRN